MNNLLYGLWSLVLLTLNGTMIYLHKDNTFTWIALICAIIMFCLVIINIIYLKLTRKNKCQ